ncbi:MAG: aspartate dehydrogenase [Burkholderiaceae bacterium]
MTDLHVGAPLRVALIGRGGIGRVLIRELQARANQGVLLVGVLARRQVEGDRELQVRSLSELLNRKPDLVVEAAGHEAVRVYGADILRAGHDLLLASVGALADDALRQELEQSARAGGSQLVLPSGGLAGLDYLQAAQLAGLDAVCLRSRKPPQAWSGTLAETRLDLSAVREATVFFNGSARQAARDFPKNANVAASLALCTLGLDRTRVELVADPSIDGNVHEVMASGAAGELHLRLCNAASPDKPKTSLVTAFSLLHNILARRSCLST